MRDIKDQLRNIGFAYCDVGGYRITALQGDGVMGRGTVEVRDRETKELVEEHKTLSPSSVMASKIEKYTD